MTHAQQPQQPQQPTQQPQQSQQSQQSQQKRPPIPFCVATLWCGDAGVVPANVDDAGTVTLRNGNTVSLAAISDSVEFGKAHAAFIDAVRAASQEQATQ